LGFAFGEASLAQESSGRRAVAYWIAWAILVIGVVTIVWSVFRDPAQMGI
jgi:hypothetical protein